MNIQNSWKCSTCHQWFTYGQQHLCNGLNQWPLIGSPSFKPFYDYSKFMKTLEQYTLQELFDELKRRKSAQDVKVKELEKEVELQKQLDKMFPEEK
jgi:hypothetical protein